MYLSGRGFSWFDFRGGCAIGSLDSLSGGIIVGKVKVIVREYQRVVSGVQRNLPNWVGNGLMIGLQGGEERVERILDGMIRRGVKISGVWIQDWCGRRKQVILGKEQSRLWWNVIYLLTKALYY